jgi:hypothetical protein
MHLRHVQKAMIDEKQRDQARRGAPVAMIIPMKSAWLFLRTMRPFGSPKRRIINPMLLLGLFHKMP